MTKETMGDVVEAYKSACKDVEIKWGEVVLHASDWMKLGDAIQALSRPAPSEASADVVEQLNRIADYVAEIGAPDYAKAIRRGAKTIAALSATPAPQADALLRDTLALLKSEAVHMEYDYPGDSPVECGLWCRICKDHVEDDNTGHAETCIIARINAHLTESQTDAD